MKPKTARKLTLWLGVAGLIFVFCGYIHTGFLALACIALGAGFVVSILFDKCPHCGKSLGRSSTDHCQHCGEKID